MNKNTKQVHFFITQEQWEKLRLIGYYTYLSVSDVIRLMIDKSEPKDFKKEGGGNNGN